MKINILMVFILMLFASCKKTGSNTPDNKLATLQLKAIFDKKNEWLIQQNSDSLKAIIHPHVRYEHSNCWIQSAEDIFDSANRDGLRYELIDVDHIDVDVIEGTGIVEGVARFKGNVKQDSFDLSLCFIETYAHTSSGWKLIARHASKKPAAE